MVERIEMPVDQQYLDDYTKKSSVKGKIDWNDYHLEAEYEYKDKEGNVLWYKKKYRHKDGKKKTLLSGCYDGKKWKSGLSKDIEKPLYRLPEFIASKEETVFILEGEKDTNNLRAWNYTAVCSPFGAKFWNPEYNQLFIDNKVILIPDNDSDGKFFTQKIGKNLIKVAASVHIVKIPKKYKDFSDWQVIKGNNEEKFKQLKVEEWKPEEKKDLGSQEKKEERIFITGRQLIEEKIPEPVVPIGKGFLVSERYTILAADDGEGKTTLCTQLALSVITGTPFLNFFPIPKPVKVLYFCGENSRGDIKAKIEFQKTEIEKILNRSIIEDLQDRLILVEPINVNFFLTQGDKKELCNWLEEIKPKIVIFDPLANFISSEKSLSDDRLARGTVSVLTEIAQEYKCFPILTTHFKKDLINPKTGRSMIAVDNAFQMVHGSKYWLNSAASQIVIVRANLQRFAKAKKLGFKFKTVTSTEPIQVLRNPNLWYEELPSDQMDKAKLTPEDVKDVLDRKFKGKALPSQIEDVAGKYLGCSQRQIRDFIKLGKKQGLFWKNKLGQIESVDLVEKNKLFDN